MRLPAGVLQLYAEEERAQPVKIFKISLKYIDQKTCEALYWRYGQWFVRYRQKTYLRLMGRRVKTCGGGRQDRRSFCLARCQQE